MNAEPLGIAVAGAGEFGAKCLEALGLVEGFGVVGVADREADRAKQAAAIVGAEPFSDSRQLLQQLRPDVLLIATPPAGAADLVGLAARTESHVIKAAPLARTLDEAVELVRLMAAADRHFAVLAPRRGYDSYGGLLAQREQLGRLFLGRAAYVLNWDPRLGWRADKASAGGGALLEAGYQMIDLLVAAMGLPEEVHAVTGRGGRPHMIETDGEVEHKGIYDTDDTAVVTLRYAGGAAGSVVTSWVTSPAAEQVVLHGQRGSGSAFAGGCVFRDVDGRVVSKIEGDDRPRTALTRAHRRPPNTC